MNPEHLLWLACGGLLITAFLATGAKALRSFSRQKLEEVCKRHQAPDRFGELIRMQERASTAVENLLALVVALLATLVTGWAWTVWSIPSDEPWRALITSALILGLILTAGCIWIPWAFVRLWGEVFLFHTWRVWRGVSVVMAPFTWAGNACDALLHRLAGRPRVQPNGDSFEEEIRTIVSEGQREGLLEEDAREMIEGVIELGDADVSEIMTPRTDVHMIHVGLSWDEMVRDVIDSRHTRIPVFDKNRDDVIGILHVKDLLGELAHDDRQRRRSLRDILRKPYYVPESKAVDDLLQEFQDNRNHIAVVLDEYGGVCGLVTIEDVLEEIVGEIVDEYDEDLVQPIEKKNDYTCEAIGKAHVDEINESMGLNLPEDQEFDTIGGFVFSQLGRIPVVGETMEWQGIVRITVLEASHRRVDRVRLDMLGEKAREIA